MGDPGEGPGTAARSGLPGRQAQSAAAPRRRSAGHLASATAKWRGDVWAVERVPRDPDRGSPPDGLGRAFISARTGQDTPRSTSMAAV